MTLTKYVLDHGFQPLAYSAVRFTTERFVAAAAVSFLGVALVAHGE